MKSIAAVSRVKVSADGHGVVSHAGVGMLREVAELNGLGEPAGKHAVLIVRAGSWMSSPAPKPEPS